MDDLPELPFEKVLSYLNLEDRLKARAVSRRWYHKINCFKVKSLCYSSRSSDFIRGKRRWVSGAFAQNFVSSTRFATFFDTFGQTILSSLKRLRLCDLDLSEGDRAAFIRTLNSFSQLEELDIIQARFNQSNLQFKLNLPMLTSLQLEYVDGIEKLTLEAPRLQQVKILGDYRTNLRVKFVHGESVERLLIKRSDYTEVKKLKNLKALYIGDRIEVIDPTFLSGLKQLKEIHLQCDHSVSELFEQKQRSGRADLKIYFCGLLLNGPEDPARNVFRFPFFNDLSGEWLACLAKNPSRLADQIPFCRYVLYPDIEKLVDPGLEVGLLKRFTDLNEIRAFGPVQDIERFLNLLKNWENISKLSFPGYHPQDLFDRLPEHCAVQKLILSLPEPSDLAFLFRLKHLIDLELNWSIDSETIRRAFDELPLLSYFRFWYLSLLVIIEIDYPKQFKVSVNGREKTVSDLNAAIEFITGTERPNQRKAEALQ